MASKLTASAAVKFDMPGTQVSGSSTRRLKSLYLEAAKTAQNDYFLLTDFLSSSEVANIAGFRGIITETSGNTASADTLTYDDDDYKIDLTSGATGVAKVWVEYWTE
jgi:hypothetical protein